MQRKIWMSQPVLLKCGLWTSCIGITWALVRKEENLRPHPRPTESESAF